VCGTLDRITQRLVVHGWRSTPPSFERINLRSPPHVLRFRRACDDATAKGETDYHHNWPCITCTTTSVCPYAATPALAAAECSRTRQGGHPAWPVTDTLRGGP